MTVWLAKDKFGTEVAFEARPHRKDDCIWGADSYNDKYLELPSGSIKKLIGRDIAWEDDPVEFEG